MKLTAKELIHQINLNEINFSEKSDLQLQEYGASLQNKIQQNNNPDELLIDSFSLVRETSKRILGLRPYDTQLLGGIYLHQGKIAEMKTGEGKTLAASLPSYLNGLSKKGVHIITVNNYLARRDQEFIGQIFRFLNLTVGLIQENSSIEVKKINYNADITYGTNSEIAFDYLRDCIARNSIELTQKEFNYCIIDEVDSILIDEARTPLILSNSDLQENSIEKMMIVDSIVRCLNINDYEIKEKDKNVLLTDSGKIKIEDLLKTNNLYNFKNPWINYINNALQAHFIFFKNNDYIVINNEVCIVDEFTGRILKGRKWSDGLHQAIEVKENLLPSSDNQVYISITYQNFFKLYKKLSGMTGTAKTEEPELQTIYDLSVEVVPTYKKTIREDLPDLVFFNEYEKWKAIEKICVSSYTKGVPLLIGTSTVAKSELLSNLLTEKKLPHQLLNARPENVNRESEIVMRAGEKSRITIATNMAGRGTDIILGGNLVYFLNNSSKIYLNKFSKLCFRSKFFLNTKKLNNQKNISSNCYCKNVAAIFKSLKKLDVKASNSKLLKVCQIFINLNGIYEIKGLIKLQKIFFQPQKIELKKLFQSKKSLNYLYFWLKNCYSYQIWFYEIFISFERNEIQNNGGLFVLGTERQDSRRIDNQLRGRCGRQGDNGITQFILSLDDRLIRLFTNNNLKNIFSNLGLELNEPLQSNLITKTLNQAQEKLESLNFTVRKQLFEFDEILELQRYTLFLEREKILKSPNPKSWIIESCEIILDELAIDLIKSKKNKFNLDNEYNDKLILLNLLLRKGNVLKEKIINSSSLKNLRSILYKEFWLIYDLVEDEYVLSKEKISIQDFQRNLILISIDEAWKNHLKKIKVLRDATSWRVFAQKKHIREYKIDSYYLFKRMLIEISYNIFKNLLLLNELNDENI